MSVTHFLLQIALLRSVEATAFGLFVFIQGFVQFGFGLSNALVSTPYTIWSNSVEDGRTDGSAYFKCNLAFSLLWGLFCAIAAMALGYEAEAWLFCLFGFLAMVRWFGRAHLYALHMPFRAAASDFVYSAFLLICLAAAWSSNLSLSIAMEILCVATAGGLFALGPGFIEKQFREAWTGSFKNYGRIWQDQSRWTLLGVVSSEATSNAHSYAVAFLAGPAAFAPIAAAMLLVKPVLMVITSFTQLERPVMVRHLTSGNPIAALRTVETFRLTVILTWIATIAAGSAVLVWLPRLLFKSSFDLGTVSVAFILWACISLLQSLATPASVLLQAAQWFRRLGWAGVAAAGVSIIAVLAAVVLLPPVWSLLGILAGQIIMNRSLSTLMKQWMTHSLVSERGAWIKKSKKIESCGAQ